MVLSSPFNFVQSFTGTEDTTICGLTGFCKPVGSPEATAVVKELLPGLMGSIEQRGTHATGIAVCDGPKDFIWKIAEPWTKVKESKPWQSMVLPAITDDMTTLIGHTRWSSVGGTDKLDSCAHPFRIGKVIGAHNGIIHNWVSLEAKVKPQVPFMVDSQVAFALLDREKNPANALKALEGYFALTWWKNNRLYVARSSAPLGMAYIKPLRLLLWNSVSANLKKLLIDTKRFNEDDVAIWEIRPGTVYKYRADKFDTAGTNVEKQDNAFEVKQAPSYWDSSRPTNIKKGGSYSRWQTRNGWDWHDMGPGTGTELPYKASQSTSTTPATESSGVIHVSDIAKNVNERLIGKDGAISLKDVVNELVALHVRLRIQDAQLKSGRERIERLEADVDKLRDQLNEFEFEAYSDAQTESDEQVFEDIRRDLADAESAAEIENTVSEPICDFCEQGPDEKKGKLMHMPGGSRMHEQCVFGLDSVSSK